MDRTRLRTLPARESAGAERRTPRSRAAYAGADPGIRPGRGVRLTDADGHASIDFRLGDTAVMRSTPCRRRSPRRPSLTATDADRWAIRFARALLEHMLTDQASARTGRLCERSGAGIPLTPFQGGTSREG
ncbi:hypothetical protein [Streptomyces sp. NPDC001056]